MPESKIEIHHITLQSLIHEMGKGVLKVPRFQRDYVWERKRVAKLFDSIYNEFPIGSFFFWITPREFRHLSKEIPELKLPEPSDYEQIKMILDGQQRITSLYVAINGLALCFDGPTKKDYKKICFDLDNKEFIVAKKTEDRERFISVWRFFNKQGENEIYDALNPERRAAFRDCQTKLTVYPISLVEVKDKQLEDAITIFERINQGGKRLSLFDLVVASTWSPDFDLKHHAEILIEKIEKTGFGEIDYETVVQTLTLLAKDQCTRAFQLQLTTDDVKDHWIATTDGLLLAIDHVRQNLGVKIFDFIPYPALLAPLAWFFARNEKRAPSHTQSLVINKWFWRTAFSQRYGSSTLTQVGNDINNYFRPLLEEKEVDVKIPVALNEDLIADLRINVNSAIKNAILCILAMKQPLHFRNNGPVILDFNYCSNYNSKEKHHIFPDSILKKQGIPDNRRNLVSNFAFLPSELNKEISGKHPSDYFIKYKKENKKFETALESHLIPSDQSSGIWTDDFSLFINQRTSLLLGEIHKLVV